MSTDELRRELDRIADSAPAIDLPDDTWARARRSTVRDRLALGAAAFAAAAVVAAGITWLPDRMEPPIASEDALGVPDHLYDAERLDVESDLDVGTAAVAWGYFRDVVVVTATGDYHRLRPEGFSDLFLTGQAFALSPDGTRLAYAWGNSETADARGIRIADLRTGAVQDLPIPDLVTAVGQLTWSTDGRWLAWSGLNVESTGGGGYKGLGPVVGRVVPGASKAQTLGDGLDDANTSLAITNEGVVLLASTSSLVRVTPGDRERTRVSLGRLSRTAVVDPATGRLGFGVGGDGPSDDPVPGTLAVLFDTTTGNERRIGGAAAGEDPRSQPLGFVGTQLLIAVRDGNGDDPRLELVGPGEKRRVAVLDAAVPIEMSVATELMSPERPTVSRPEPDWPIDWGTWWPAVLIAATLVVGFGLLALLSRYRRPARYAS